MSFINSIPVLIFYQKVGEDQFSNKYYQSRGAKSNGQMRRCVIYKGIEEPSKVPPLWHLWLHHISDEIPSSKWDKLDWQEEHKPNLTGTKFAYSPVKEDAKGKMKFAAYEPWKPKR